MSKFVDGAVKVVKTAVDDVVHSVEGVAKKGLKGSFDHVANNLKATKDELKEAIKKDGFGLAMKAAFDKASLNTKIYSGVTALGAGYVVNDLAHGRLGSAVVSAGVVALDLSFTNERYRRVDLKDNDKNGPSEQSDDISSEVPGMA